MFLESLRLKPLDLQFSDRDKVLSVTGEEDQIVFDSEDGFLALDENGNGVIDNRTELFGGNIGEGFAQLKAIDGNRDGKLDANDSRFNALKVWRDANGNHVTDKGELFTLSDFDIISLNTGYTIVPEQQYGDVPGRTSPAGDRMSGAGNWLIERSTATKEDGSTMQMADVYFETPKATTERQPEHRGATLTVQSQPATPKIPQFPWNPSPILVNWPSPNHTALGNHEQHPSYATPRIEWSTWTGDKDQIDKDKDKDDDQDNYHYGQDSNPDHAQTKGPSWLDDFLGVQETKSRDLSKATGLTVKIKGEGKGKN